MECTTRHVTPRNTSNHLSRRRFLQAALVGGACAVATGAGIGYATGQSRKRPNIVLVMSDDQGWGDVAYNGNPIVQTPHLDAMARVGLCLDRFYAAAPVCSPTRGSCLTGRHPYRYGIHWANDGHLPDGEATIAEGVRAAGYRTGHFGKWHLGGLSKTVEDGLQGGPEHAESYSPPWQNGFDTCFSCELGGPTYNPSVWCNGHYPDDYELFMGRPVERGEDEDTPGCHRWPSVFWTGPGQIETDNLDGDSSRVIMDRAVDFMRDAVESEEPFLAVIWFFTPHSPLAAGDRHRAPYAHLSIPEQHWYGCLTAMDEQIGRLRATLRSLGVAEDTLVWFCSDNGPSWIHEYNSTGPYRGKKGSLYEGGVRVPAIIEWPARFPTARVVDAACCTSDFYPTIQAITGFGGPEVQAPLDGVNMLPVLEAASDERPAPIAFQSPLKGDTWQMDPSKQQRALIGNRYKLISQDNGATYELYDLLDDPGETADIAESNPEVVARMQARLTEWVAACAEDAKAI